MSINQSLWILFSVFFLSSCMTLDSNKVVLKKSIDPTPDWITRSGEINKQNSNFVNLVYKKENLYNLPLALKQSQAIISKKSDYVLLKEVQNQFKNKLISLNGKVDEASLNFFVSNILSKRPSFSGITALRANKIYWEYHKELKDHTSKNCYVVWVLLLIPKNVYDRAILAIAHELQNSKNDAFVSLGNEMLRHPENLSK